MERKIRRDARLAALCATLVCTWALVLVAVGLAAPLRDHSPAPRSAAVLAADTRR